MSLGRHGKLCIYVYNVSSTFGTDKSRHILVACFLAGQTYFLPLFFSEILALLVDIKIILERGVGDGNQHKTNFIIHNPTFSISRSRSSSEITTGLDFDVFNSRGYTISMGAVSTPLNDLLNFLAGVTAGVLWALT